MAPLLSWLETWTAYQDYAWFLALLAWITVVAGAWPRRLPDGQTEAEPWLVALGLACLAWPVLELSLLVWDLPTPYRTHDFLLGLALAAMGGVLAWHRWGMTWTGRRRWWALAVVVTGVLALSSLRALTATRLPGAVIWAVAIGGAAITVWFDRTAWQARTGRGSARWLRAGVLWLAALPVVAPHGPLAVWAREPRLASNLSHFALLASGLLLLVGVLLAVGLWRRRVWRVGEFSRFAWSLVGWLVVGLLFVVWTGHDARRALEENLLHRARMAAALLDPGIVRATIGGGAPVEQIVHDWYTEAERPGKGGVTVEVAILRGVQTPAFSALRAYLKQVKTACPDVSFVSVVAPWQGRWVVVATSADVESDAHRQLVMDPVVAPGVAQEGKPAAYLEGPLVSASGGSSFWARVAVNDTAAGPVGQLVMPIGAAVWTRTFLRARLQAMALVGVGFILWGLALAYRIRREEMHVVRQAAETAAAADRMKSAFLAKVSHELRTPIQSVLGYGELLEQSPINPEQRQWLTALRSHGTTMLRLVNDLIDLGSLQTGLFRLQPAPVSLAVLVPECVAALSPQANRKGLNVLLTVAPDVPDWVEGDAVRLRQILVNLIANAVKYTPRGQVEVAVRWVDKSVHFIVADTGPGIPPAKRADLFRPFSRLATTTEVEGSGVGLALVAGLCAAMGGRVYYDEAGPGATFVAALPLRGATAPSATAVTPTGATFAGLRVVLADDNLLVRELLTTYLRSQGAVVEPVGDGVEAVAACERQWPQVLLLDLSMPRMDGLTAAQTVRARAAGRALRIIGLSAHAQAADDVQARQAGMDAFLVKPVSLGLLAATLVPQGTPPVTAAAPDDPMAAVMVKIHRQYAAETPPLVEEMQVACRAHDWPRLRRQAHYLKNSADVLRIGELQAACQRLFDWTSHPADPAEGSRHLAAVVAAVAQSLVVTPAP